jgi:hypothetical protein
MFKKPQLAARRGSLRRRTSVATLTLEKEERKLSLVERRTRQIVSGRGREELKDDIK